ncbi:MAG: phosphoribosylaminoimidazolesuccinocarboxamide synthase [Planctomycetota bacterium]
MELAQGHQGRAPRLGSLDLVASGKVRDLYAVDDERLLFVTSDRVSAFDVILPRTIPHKGRVLTSIAAHWFERTRDLVPNHLLSTDPADVPGLDRDLRRELAGRIMLVRRAEPTSVEWVVRGYLAGSGLKEYRATGAISGQALPPGLELASRLPGPLLTPTTKDEDHDRPLTLAEAEARVGGQVFRAAERTALALFERGTRELAAKGILLADTKFEFGLQDGKLLLIDEALTPDSSRFWPAAGWSPGTNPASYDKQVLRDYLETLSWNKSAPGPELPDAIVAALMKGYLEICRTLTGSVPPGADA